jgi:hypothetical protein
VRPPKNWSARTCACEPRSGRARCVRATQKTVATHPLEKCHEKIRRFRIQDWSCDASTMFFCLTIYFLLTSKFYNLDNPVPRHPPCLDFSSKCHDVIRARKKRGLGSLQSRRGKKAFHLASCGKSHHHDIDAELTG